VTILKRRDRVLVFRLTQDEYDHLSTACSAKGGRNLSDFARSELLTVLQSGQQVNHLQGRLSMVEDRLSEVQLTLRQVTQILERIAGPAS